ncbi:hypothetical protein LZK98_11885 [Sphingomonas cannabina]|uniref:hypothetical protein n=1 Tax=Sphingomonas cannabina TaxID=2899123 RepID=UPI001F26E276|nr:hypothetical protein [Sphingomonas cannabina]UIJ43792.1 hypothetical protein LZK98_11885 [Sphingomonas cannabina]
MTRLAIIDEHEITITPVFKYLELENIPKSEARGRKVMEMHEVVEVRFAGSKNFSPVFPAHEFCRREGNHVITYAERWAEQYRAFKDGNPQEAAGTPLEMLRDHGVTPEQLALCRALRIYSVEALHDLEGQAAKSLGIHQNVLKDAARAFMADRLSSQNALSEIEALRKRIAELESRSTAVPEKDSTPEEIERAIQAADAAYADMTDDQIKDEIAKITGSRPRGNPNRRTLEQSLSELLAA